MKKADFSRTHTLIIKSIAVIMMLIHHLLLDVDKLNYYGVNSSFISNEGLSRIAMFCKCCVCIFAFLSGYGLTKIYMKYKMKGQSDISFVIKRYFLLILDYGFVVVLSLILLNRYYPVSSIYGIGPTAIYYAIIDILGFACVFQTPTYNLTWWYMSVASGIIILLPSLKRFIDRMGALSLVMIYFVVYFWVILLPQFMYIAIPFLAVSLGIYVSINECLDIVANRIYNEGFLIKGLVTIFSVLCIFIIYKIRIGIDVGDFGLIIIESFISLPICLFAIGLSSIFGKYVNWIGVLIGKQSANVFWIHTFIFYILFEKEIYSIKNPILMVMVLLLTSLIISWAIECIKYILRFNKIKKMLRESF